MKERIVRIAKWNQRNLGALLLALVYLLAIGPSSVAMKIGRLFGPGSKAQRGWQPLARSSLVLDDLKEQS